MVEGHAVADLRRWTAKAESSSAASAVSNLRSAAAAALARALTRSDGVTTVQELGIARPTRSGWKLKNVASTTPAVTAPIGAARHAK